MAGNFEKFNNDVEKFNKEHGVNFNFRRYEIALNQTIHMRSTFAVGDKNITAEDFAYRKVAKELFREAMESTIAKKANSADYTAFLNDFDKLMDIFREYCDQTGCDKPSKNGKWSGVELLDDMRGKIQDIPEDKSDFVKNKYVNRSFRLRDMRADIESMGKENNNTVTAEELSRAIVYQRALEKAIKERSAAWRAFHWFQGPAEKRDLETIKAFIAQHQDIYEKAEAFANENPVGETKSKIDAAKEEIKAAELLKPRRLKGSKQADERLRNPKVSEHVRKLMVGVLKESRSGEVERGGIAGAIFERSQTPLRQMWQAFENASDVQAKENAIIKYTQAIFNENLKWLRGIKFNSTTKEHEMIVANQRITNLLLRQYSPATSERAYDKFCENYVIKDEKFMEGFLKTNFEITDISKEDLKNIIGELTADLAGKQKIKIFDKDVISDNGAKSEKQTSARHIEGQVKIH